MGLLDTFIHKTLKRPYLLAKVYDTGEGKPVVLLHGIASSSKLWQPLVTLHDASARLISFDLLGFGKSPKPGWLQYDVEEHVKSVERSIRKLRLRQPVTLVGHSMGCLVAIHTALRNPKLISHLVLFEPPLLADMPHIKPYDRRKQVYLRAFGYIASRQELVTKSSERLGRWIGKISAFSLDDEEWLPFERSLRHTIMRQTAYDELLALHMPTDIIYGRRDLVVIRKHAAKLFAKSPHITLHTVAEGHGLTKRSARYLLKIILG